jgi:hypothetical protein
VPYDGDRSQAECQLAGKIHGQPLGVDVAFGDPMLGEVAAVTAEDLLAFAGIAPRRRGSIPWRRTSPRSSTTTPSRGNGRTPG